MKILAMSTNLPSLRLATLFSLAACLIVLLLVASAAQPTRSSTSGAADQSAVSDARHEQALYSPGSP